MRQQFSNQHLLQNQHLNDQAKSQAFHRHLSMKFSDKMHENSAGYNAYFLKSNLNAL